MTAEWCDGYKITDLDRIRADRFSLREIDQKLFNTFAEQIFSTGFVHADPHPGNGTFLSFIEKSLVSYTYFQTVFIRKNKKGKLEIVLLDHGLYETLPSKVRNSLCNFWEAIVVKDVTRMKRYAAELQVDGIPIIIAFCFYIINNADYSQMHSDYDKLAEVLLQRPLDLGVNKLSTRLTEQDIAYMQHMAKERFDTVLNTLKQMPRQMLFVIRCESSSGFCFDGIDPFF